jgi:CRISPR-associated protein Cmr6
MTINMRRGDLQCLDNTNCQHAGLLLDRGFKTWTDQHNQDIATLHHQASKIAFSKLYQKAYEQWYQQQLNNPKTCAIWFAELESRLFVGMGTASPLEAGISLHHTYGVPYIPGTAIKGVLHHYAQAVELSGDVQNILFGKETSQTDRRDSGEAGYIIFNDAWWIPEGLALAPEIITVHHQDYYASQGEKPATDFDSPNPNPQIAIQGSFLFSLEGEQSLIRYAIALLKEALIHSGIGAKTSSGYGYFVEDKKHQQQYKNVLIEKASDNAKGIEKIAFMVKKLTEKQAIDSLSKGLKNKTPKLILLECKEFSEKYWDEYLAQIKQCFPDAVKQWSECTDEDTNKYKAHKAMKKSEQPAYDKFKSS